MAEKDIVERLRARRPRHGQITVDEELMRDITEAADLIDRLRAREPEGWRPIEDISDPRVVAAEKAWATWPCVGDPWQVRRRLSYAVNAAVAAALASSPEPASAWQTMESAPKDGGEVLLQLTFRNGVRAYWDEQLQTWVLSVPCHIESLSRPEGWRPRHEPAAPLSAPAQGA